MDRLAAMNEAAPVKLDDHTPISQTTIHGGCSILFGLPFLGAGVLIVLLSTGSIPMSEDSLNAPPWVISVVGGVFGLAGLFLIGNGIAGMIRKARRQRLLEEHRNEPWLADHPWDREKAPDRLAGSWARTLFGGIAMGIFLAPFNWIAFFSGQGGFLWRLIVGVFDLLLLLVLGMAIYEWLRSQRYGASYLRWRHFPFFLGETLEAELWTDQPIPGPADLTVTLRAVEERFETRRVGNKRRSEVVAYQHHSESTNEYRDAGFPPGRIVDLAFELPEDGLATALSERPAHYWEVEVTADAPGIDYNASFLVPVYARR